VFPGNALTESTTLALEWFDGEFYPPEAIRALYSVPDYPTESAMLIGTRGAMLIPSGTVPFLLPEDKFKDVPRPKFSNRNHYHHFVEACLGGEMTESHFAQSGPMTEAILLGTVAVRVPGQKLEWDARALKISNAPDAEKLLRRSYREGWSVGPS
jgi:hypothetical protein